MPILRGKEMGRAFLCWRQKSAYARRGKPDLIIAAKEQSLGTGIACRAQQRSERRSGE